MKNRHRTGSLRPLLFRYSLDEPLPPEIRERIAADYSRIYRKISEKTTRPTVIAALVAWLFFLVKKAGIPVTLAKFAATAVVVATIGTGVYVVVNSRGPASLTHQAPVSHLNSTVAVRPFVSRSLGSETGKACADSLRKALDTRYGSGFSRIVSGPGIGEGRWTVFGSVEKSGSREIMIVKLVDARTSRTVFMAEEQCSGAKDCARAAARITKKFPVLQHR